MFFNDTATTKIYTRSLHDALPIFGNSPLWLEQGGVQDRATALLDAIRQAPEHALDTSRYPISEIERVDRKSTRLNSSHANISYAVFCLKKTAPLDDEKD